MRQPQRVRAAAVTVTARVPAAALPARRRQCRAPGRVAPVVFARQPASHVTAGCQSPCGHCGGPIIPKLASQAGVTVAWAAAAAAAVTRVTVAGGGIQVNFYFKLKVTVRVRVRGYRHCH